MQHVVNESNLYVLLACVFFCVCVVVYNALNLLRRRWEQRKLEERAGQIYKLIISQLARLRRGERPDPAVTRALLRGLRRPARLFALESVYPLLVGRQSASPSEMRAALLPVFEGLCNRYHNAEEMVRVYLASLLQMYGLYSAAIGAFLFKGLSGKSLYLRIQCFRCITAAGNERLTIEALKLPGVGRELSVKCITDTLMDYSGDKDGLAAAAMYALPQLGATAQCAVAAMMGNLGQSAFRQDLLEWLQDARTDKEARIALIKYFRALPYLAALPTLLELALHPDWEVAAVACLALGSYPGAQSIKTLKRRVADRNWYVRFNCAQSLARLCPVSQLQDVLNSFDRYARDIMLYALTLASGGRAG